MMSYRGLYAQMWIFCLCVGTLVMCAYTAVAELRCVHPQCAVGGVEVDEQTFTVEGQEISITHNVGSGWIAVYCHGWHALDSPAMPSFTSVFHARSVELSSCPLPTTTSIADALFVLNVTQLQHHGDSFGLTLAMLPSEPPLVAHHFTNLKRIEELQIYTEPHSAPLLPAAGFLAGLKTLHSLDLTNVLLPLGELSHPPPALRSLKLFNTGIKRLPEALLVLPSLQNLEVYSERTGLTAMFEVPPPGLNTLSIHSKNTTLKLDKFPAVTKIRVTKWTERRPQVLTQCDELLLLELTDSVAEALPEHWVAACPRLDVLRVHSMRKLLSLPQKLLAGASALTTFSFISGVLETLPEGLLEGAPNLLYVYLIANRLHTIPSGAFVGCRELFSIDLRNNLLDRSSLAALTPLTRLNWLDLSNNPRLSDLCDHNGYSPLLNLTQLKKLDLSSTNITRICRDWRENLKFLGDLWLKKTQISELRYDDFQYTRDETFQGEVRLDGAPVTSVRFTEHDYKRAVAAPRRTAAWVRITSRLECDCRMYWTRLVKERAKHKFRVKSLLCTGNRNLNNVTADKICVPTTNASLHKGTGAAISAHADWLPRFSSSVFDGYLILSLIFCLIT